MFWIFSSFNKWSDISNRKINLSRKLLLLIQMLNLLLMIQLFHEKSNDYVTLWLWEKYDSWMKSPLTQSPQSKSPIPKITPAHNHPYPKSPLKNSPLPKITPAQYHPCRWITPTQNHPCRWITSGLKPNYLT